MGFPQGSDLKRVRISVSLLSAIMKLAVYGRSFVRDF